MMGRCAVALAILVSTPAFAGERMTPEQARRFVAGKLFSFNCFDGTVGQGRILNDGSVAGAVRVQGKGPMRYVVLPQNTVRVKPDKVCASVKGLFFEPCFDLVRTSDRSFRGSISGFGLAYCDFVRRGGGRAELAHMTTPTPTPTSSRPFRPASAKPAPVTPAPVTPVERAEIRSTIAP